MDGHLVCPEFLPAVARLAARFGFQFGELLGACPGAASDLVVGALRSAAAADDVALRYVAQRLLHGGPAAAADAEPEVGATISGLLLADLARLALPGTLVVRLRSPVLVREEDGTFSWFLDPALAGSTSSGEMHLGPLDGVISEVLYEDSTQLPTVVRLEAVCLPCCHGVDAGTATCEERAVAWASELCRRHGAVVFTAPARHAALARLLAALRVHPAALSACSGESRGQLSATLVELARAARGRPSSAGLPAALEGPAAAERIMCAVDGSADGGVGGALVPFVADTQEVHDARRRAAFSELCLAAASPSSQALAAGQRLLLINGRDYIPPGALAAGASVVAERGGSVDVSFAGGTGDLHCMPLAASRAPRSRLPVTLPQRGDLIACLLLAAPGAESEGEPVLSLVGSGSFEMDDVLAQQVGLRSLRVQIPGGQVGTARACRCLAESCGVAVSVRISEDGAAAHVVGPPAEAAAAVELLKGLRRGCLDVSVRVAQALSAGDGRRLRALERAAGAVRLQLRHAALQPTVELLGSSAAVEHALELLRQRYTHASLELSAGAAHWILGPGGTCRVARDIEEQCAGVSIQLDMADIQVPRSRWVEALGPAAAVEKAVALLRGWAAPAARRKVTQPLAERLVAKAVGRRLPAAVPDSQGRPVVLSAGGAVLQVAAAEAKPGLGANQFSGGEHIVEIWGSQVAVAKAEGMLDEMAERHATARFHVPRHAVVHTIGRGGEELRRIAEATGATLRAEHWQEPCVVQVAGERVAVDAALEELRYLAAAQRRHVEVPAEALPRALGPLGTTLAEIEAETGTRLHLDVSALPRIEVVGEQDTADAAVKLLQDRIAGVTSSFAEVALERRSPWTKRRRAAADAGLASERAVTPPPLRSLQRENSGAAAATSGETRRRSRSLRGGARAAGASSRRAGPAALSASALPWAWTATIRGVPRAARAGASPLSEAPTAPRPRPTSPSEPETPRAPKLRLPSLPRPVLAAGIRKSVHVTSSTGAIGVPWSWTLPLQVRSPRSSPERLPAAEEDDEKAISEDEHRLDDVAVTMTQSDLRCAMEVPVPASPLPPAPSSPPPRARRHRLTDPISASPPGGALSSPPPVPPPTFVPRQVSEVGTALEHERLTYPSPCVGLTSLEAAVLYDESPTNAQASKQPLRLHRFSRLPPTALSAPAAGGEVAAAPELQAKRRRSSAAGKSPLPRPGGLASRLWQASVKALVAAVGRQPRGRRRSMPPAADGVPARRRDRRAASLEPTKAAAGKRRGIVPTPSRAGWHEAGADSRGPWPGQEEEWQAPRRGRSRSRADLPRRTACSNDL